MDEKYDLFDRLETDRLELVPRMSYRRANELLEEIQKDDLLPNFNLLNVSCSDFVEEFRLGIDRYSVFCRQNYTEINLVGLVALDVDDKDNSCSIGYYILPKYRRKGFAFEIVSKVIDELKGKTIKANTLKDNERSISLLKKLDFEFVEEKDGNVFFQKK